MTAHYSSFLIRCWHLASGDRRIVVEHVQTGEQTTVATFDAAAGWIGSWAEGPREPTDDREADAESTNS